MKRLNYYQIHKNKKPKRIKRSKRKVSHIPLIACMMAMSAIRIAMVQNSPFLDPISKRIKICIEAADSAIAISEVFQKMKNVNLKKLYYETFYKAKADPGLRFKKRKHYNQKASC